MATLAINLGSIEEQPGTGNVAGFIPDSATSSGFSDELDLRLSEKTEPSLKSEVGIVPKRSGGKSSPEKDGDQSEETDLQASSDTASWFVATALVVPASTQSDVAVDDKTAGDFQLSAKSNSECKVDLTGNIGLVPAEESVSTESYVDAGNVESQLGVGREDTRSSQREVGSLGLNTSVDVRDEESAPTSGDLIDLPWAPDARVPQTDGMVLADDKSVPLAASAEQANDAVAVTASQPEEALCRVQTRRNVMETNHDVTPISPVHTSVQSSTAIAEDAASPRVAGLVNSGTQLQKVGAETPTALHEGADLLASQVLSFQAEGLQKDIGTSVQSTAGNADQPLSETPSMELSAAASPLMAERQTSRTHVDSEEYISDTSVTTGSSLLEGAPARQPLQTSQIETREDKRSDTPANHGEGETTKEAIRTTDNTSTTDIATDALSIMTGQVDAGSISKAETTRKQVPMASAVVAEDYGSRTGKIVTSARLLEAAGNAEMQVKLHSDALGPIEVHTVMKGSGIGASFHVEATDAQMVLTSELPQLERALNEKSLHVDHLDVCQNSSSGGSADTSDSGTSQGNTPESRNPFASYSLDHTYTPLPEIPTVYEDGDLSLSLTRVNLRV